MNIGIDMMGGDFAPQEAVKGLLLHLNADSSPANIYCIGDEIIIKSLFEEHNISSPFFAFNTCT